MYNDRMKKGHVNLSILKGVKHIMSHQTIIRRQNKSADFVNNFLFLSVSFVSETPSIWCHTAQLSKTIKKTIFDSFR